jgi:hypothetical protein
VRDGKPCHWTLWGCVLQNPPVDHGENFANGENGMAELTDRVKQIYDTYANENTYFDCITLVGC